MHTRRIEETNYRRLVYLDNLPGLVRQGLIGQRLFSRRCANTGRFTRPCGRNEKFPSSAVAAEAPTPNCDPLCGQREAERSSPHEDQQIRARLRARETTAAAGPEGRGIPRGMRLEIYCNIAALPTINKHKALKLSRIQRTTHPSSLLSFPFQARTEVAKMHAEGKQPRIPEAK